MDIEDNDSEKAYIEMTKRLLQQRYLERTLLPGRRPQEALSLQLLQRLLQHVISEHVISEGHGE